ncbi:MAG: fluoride efflux transporter CrcB [Chloroflexota bacterium]|nr:fluoride efflux transporter CrcB [Chloroflexota bacterium]
MLDVLLVGIGGFVGANARFILSNWFARRMGTTFPYGTLFINVSGSFILGLFLALVGRSILADETYRWLVAVGFCGGYTTFSTYTYETLTLIRDTGFWRGIVINLLGSYLLGLGGALIGFWLGNLL